MRWERLTGSDMAMLWPDDLGWPQDIGVLAILEGASLTDPTSALVIGDLQEQIGARLRLLPRFRQCLHRPGFAQGLPYWADDPSFEITRHVRARDLPAPGDEAQLLATCEEIRRRRFDTSHPLWEFWFLTGLSEGRVGLFIKLHHALVDGAAGLAALGVFLDPTPDAEPATPMDWTPDPAPNRTELMSDNLRRLCQRLRGWLIALFHPRPLFRRIRQAATATRRILDEAGAPRTSLNAPIGERRRVALVRSDLDAVKETAHSAGGKVNDVLLNAIAGGVRDLLAGRDEPMDGLLPRAIVPIAGGLDPESGNNTASGILVPLPIEELDAHHRLQAIATETARSKRSPLSYAEAGFLNSPMIQRLSARLAGRQRVSNLYVANLAGPPMHLYLNGARILELFPLVPLVGNTTIGVGALSYAGQFNLTVVADYDACPDVDVFVEGVGRSLNRMGVSR